MMKLEDEADVAIADLGEGLLFQTGHRTTSDQDIARGREIQHSH